jgi:predicted alpha/beta-fold hydrolase
MPLIENSAYKPPLFFNNGHLQTVFPSLFRQTDVSLYQRERVETPDDDFLDIDWARTGSKKLAVISHGLEGDSRRHYVVGMARTLNRHGWDAMAWNYRSCSGEVNRRLRMYHNGVIDDLDCVIQHALKTGNYDTVALVGFSLGGNLTLMYLGSGRFAIDSRISRSAVFSVPCDLAAGAGEIGKPKNRIYMKRFLSMLHKKVKMKMSIMPDAINDDNYHLIKDFKDFDNRYTAPIHGFRDAEDYWQKCSSRQFIRGIKVPTLIVNAVDDPFLAGGCYPVSEAAGSRYVYLEMPQSGGHVGFVQFNRDGSYWSENRAVEFLR